MTYVEINFDDEICALILLASLPNTWELMQVAVSNSIGKGKLQFNDVGDRILIEEVHRMDLGEGTSSSSALRVGAARRILTEGATNPSQGAVRTRITLERS